jgi:UDP-N-acetylglucosamine 2-epimerase (non-hydrolysing)
MTRPLEILLVAGARPNFMKIAPLVRALDQLPNVRQRIVHTGQHFDANMSGQFFAELRIPEPWRNLGVSGGGHAQQTAEILARFDEVLASETVDLVIVVGDVNSTIAAALAAVKRGIPVAHVEAGLRSGDRTMPEEINRLLTDAISDVLYVSEPSGLENLRREGVSAERVVFAGNVMIDTLLEELTRARARGTVQRLGLCPKSYGLVTLHRPANVDDTPTLQTIFQALGVVATKLPLLFPVHPRTRQRLAQAGIEAPPGVTLQDPMGYTDFLGLMDGAALILTDSGGIQEEACILGVPCLTLRENTERPVTVTCGGNQLVGRDLARIVAAAERVLKESQPAPRRPELWDGHAAQRIAKDLWNRYGSKA